MSAISLFYRISKKVTSGFFFQFSRTKIFVFLLKKLKIATHLFLLDTYDMKTDVCDQNYIKPHCSLARDYLNLANAGANQEKNWSASFFFEKLDIKPLRICS